ERAGEAWPGGAGERAIVRKGVESRHVQHAHGRRIFLITVAVVLAAAFTCSSAAPGPFPLSSLPAAADRLIRSGLKDLHDGLYGKAEETFRAAAEAAPGDPAPTLFIAFASWWRTLQARSDRTVAEHFLGAVREAPAEGRGRP